MKKLNWGILGYARIARTCVLPALKEDENSVLYALATRSESCKDEAINTWGFEKVYTSYDNLLDDPNVDVVYIPLPNTLHKEWAIKAMNKGKNVLCEKPMAMSESEAVEMFDAAKKNNVFLMEAYMYRFIEKFAKVAELLNDGVIGDIRMVKTSWRYLMNRVNTIKEKPDLGGGCLYDVGCYPVSLINAIMKEIPEEIKTLRNINDKGVDVSFSAILKYKDGKMAQFDVGFDSISSKCTEISGTKGTILVPEIYVDDKRPIQVFLPNEPEPQTIWLKVQNRYLEEVKAVSSAILSGKKELLDYNWSIMNAKVLNLIMKS